MNTAVMVTIMKVAAVAMVVVMTWMVTAMTVAVIVMAVDNGVIPMVMIKVMIMLVMVMVVMMAEMVTVVKAVEANVHLFIISCNLTTLSGRPHLGDRKGSGTGKVIWQLWEPLSGKLTQQQSWFCEELVFTSSKGV